MRKASWLLILCQAHVDAKGSGESIVPQKWLEMMNQWNLENTSAVLESTRNTMADFSKFQEDKLQSSTPVYDSKVGEHKT